MYWKSLIIVAYYPQFSKEFKTLVKENCKGTMKELDGDGNQYHIDEIGVLMEDYEWIVQEDINILAEATINNVEYFEF